MVALKLLFIVVKNHDETSWFGSLSPIQTHCNFFHSKASHQKKKKKQNTKIKYEVGIVFEEKEGKPGVLSNYFSILVTSYPHHYHYHMPFCIFFYLFCGRQKQGFCSYISSIAIRNSDLRSSCKSDKVICWFYALNDPF